MISCTEQLQSLLLIREDFYHLYFFQYGGMVSNAKKFIFQHKNLANKGLMDPLNIPH